MYLERDWLQIYCVIYAVDINTLTTENIKSLKHEAERGHNK